eukprot:COSAG02_NODE_1162_length_14168_cov_10.478570_4_plen_76_part_00
MVQVIGQLDLLLGTQLALRLPDIDPTVSLRVAALLRLRACVPACLPAALPHCRTAALPACLRACARLTRARPDGR